MAIKYNGNKAVLSGMREDVVAPNDFWQDFTKFLTEADYYNTAFKGNYDSYFGGLTADWDAQDYQNFFNANGITDAVQGNSNVDISQITDLNKLKAIMGSMVIDQLGHFSNNKYKLPSTEINKLKEGIKAYNAHSQLVTNLRNKGGTDEQIQAILDSRDGSADGYTTLYDDIADLSGDAWNSYIADNFAKNNVLPDNTWGSGDTAYTIDNATLAGANPVTPTEQAEDAVNNATFGDPTNPDGLTPVKDANGNVVDGEFTDANGKTFYLTDNGEYRDADGNPYISPDQSTVVTEIDDDQASSDAAEEVVDQAVQDVAAGADTAADIQTSVLGGDVSTGVAEQLGWEKGTKEVDGKTVTTFTDPRTNTTYDVDPDTGMLTDTDGNTVSTVGSLNFEENDFAQQFTDAANEFLYGSAVTAANAEANGFTRNTDNSFTGPDGRTYTLGANNTLVDADGNALRSDGLRDYQNQMKDANATYQAEMGTLRDSYDQAYTSYESELQPYQQQMDDTTAGLIDVAQDANDTNYYGRLTDLYYADARDEIDRNARGAKDTLNQTYANAGLDASSPAYTKALMDLEQKRSDSARSSRRQAILDSYGLGTQMLTNRTNALNSAQTGIRSGMDALGDLYDVRLEGLGVERDMISTIYEGKQEGARLGMEGLGVTTGLEQDRINTNQTQYFKGLDVRTGLNNNTVNTNVTAANTATTADANATDDYWTGMGWLQTLIDNNFNWGATGAALQTQFPDFDFSTLDPKLLQQLQITP